MPASVSTPPWVGPGARRRERRPAGIVKLPLMLPPVQPVVPVSVAVAAEIAALERQVGRRDGVVNTPLDVTRLPAAAPVKLVPLLKFCVAPP